MSNMCILVATFMEEVIKRHCLVRARATAQGLYARNNAGGFHS